jgi:hypothetical protein
MPLRLTFERRATYIMPAELTEPLPEWQLPFRALAEERRLPPDIHTIFVRTREFLERTPPTREASSTQHD